MLSISDKPMSSGQGNYYLNLAREDYYLEGGEPPGQWYGQGATELNLKGNVNKKTYHHIAGGFSGSGKEKLVKNAGKENHRAGWDLTFSAPKSVSVYWSQSDKQTRQLVQQAHDKAVNKALDYLEQDSETRRGQGGKIKEQAKLVIAKFEHGTSREQDPQLHTHSLVMNIGVRKDDTTGTIESWKFYANKMAAGALYRAELAKQLEQKLGLEIEKKKNWFEVKGVNQKLIETFSKRRQQIEKDLKKKGNYSAKAAKISTLSTREVKGHVARDNLFQDWQTIGKAHKYQSPTPTVIERDIEQANATLSTQAIATITEQNSSFTRRDLVRNLAENAQGQGIGAEEIIPLVDTTLEGHEVICLGKIKNETRYTTTEMLGIERAILKCVSASEHTVSHEINTATLETVQAQRTLNPEQVEALKHITDSKGSIKVVSGLAGTGKTYMLDAARDVWEREGYTVMGAAIAAKAASGLESGSGINSQTLHRTLWELEQSSRYSSPKKQTFSPLEMFKTTFQHQQKSSSNTTSRFDEKTVLVIDEAGMVGTRQMNRLLKAANTQGIKVVLVGDHRQLQPINAGGAFHKIGAMLGQSELVDIRRQQQSWARDAVVQMTQGKTKEVLKSYAEQGLLSVRRSKKQAMKALIKDWREDGMKNLQSTTILAATNAEVTGLNRMAQHERLKAEELSAKSLQINQETFYQHDRIVFTRNAKSLGVKNGQLGTIHGIKGSILTVNLDDSDHPVTIDTKDYDHLKLGYAITTHKAQGVTVENSYVLLGGGMQDRELSYVQLSRSKQQTKLYTDRLDAGDDLAALSKKMARSRQKTLALEELQRTQSAFDALHQRSAQMVSGTQNPKPKNAHDKIDQKITGQGDVQDDSGSVNDAHKYRHRRGGR